jgi:signal peptidase I
LTELSDSYTIHDMKMASYTRYFKSIFLHLLGAVIILFIVMQVVASFIKIEGSSMHPVLRDQERIIVLKMALAKNHINRLDIIVFSSQDNNPKKRIKRIIGLPSEQIEIRAGTIYINNRILKQTGSPASPVFKAGTISMDPVQIPPDHYFVIGENLLLSKDSRDFGLIPLNTIIGKAILRYWPFSRFGTIS